MKNLQPLFLLIILSLVGCLKTRNNVRADDDQRGVPAKVQDVKANDSYVVDEMKAEITRLNGRIEDLERAQREGSSNKQQEEESKKLQARIAELEQTQLTLLETVKKLQANAAPVDAKESYEKGKEAFESSRFEEAAKELSVYLKSGATKNIEDATFMRGESYFENKEYKKAIVDFSKFYEKYSKSKKAPHAVLRIAQSFDALGMKEDAASFYQEVVDKYPKSKEAKEARGSSTKKKSANKKS